MKPAPPDPCPCGSGAAFAACCGRYHAGAATPTPEALMRSRYSAFVRRDVGYLLATWHSSTRPAHLDFDSEPPAQWIGLAIKAVSMQDEAHGTVEFVARHRIGGRAFRLHERSRFVREDGRWVYLDGDGMGKSAV